MIQVEVNCRDPRKHQQEVATALSVLKREMKKAGVMNDLRKREHYTPPSKARRLKRAESQKQRKRDAKKQQWQRKNSDF
jgi:ribosomal protein S21